MVDIAKHIEYWRKGFEEDLDVAKQLIAKDKIRHGLFFAHLAVEKLLKACACKTTRKVAPRIHNLVRLAEIAKLDISDEDKDLLAEMNEFNLEGRYPVPFIAPVSKRRAEEYLKRMEDISKWLIEQL